MLTSACQAARSVADVRFVRKEKQSMTYLPRVTEFTHERVAREFDDLGPVACMSEITQSLRKENPELLDMASKCAVDVGETAKIMTGFGMFYRLLIAQSVADPGGPLMNPLPRVTAHTRDVVVEEIDRAGAEAFTLGAIGDLERTNPELLQMAHDFASRRKNYIRVMQGFALLYRSLLIQSSADRPQSH
jgi:hypothetical protein